MLGVLRSVAPQQSPLNDPPRVKFRTVLGLGAAHKNFESASRPAPCATDGASHHPRRSADTVTSHSLKRNHRRDRSSTVVDPSFFAPVERSQSGSTSTNSEMKNSTAPQSMPTQRRPIRVDNQDGPWTVSVAETPHYASSYSIYIKSEYLVPRVSCSTFFSISFLVAPFRVKRYICGD